MLPSRPVTHIVHIQCSFDFLLKCGVRLGMVILGTLRGERREKYPQLSDPELTMRPRQQLPLHEGICLTWPKLPTMPLLLTGRGRGERGSMGCPKFISFLEKRLQVHVLFQGH